MLLDPPTNPSFCIFFLREQILFGASRSFDASTSYYRSFSPVFKLPGAFDFFPRPFKRRTSLVAVTVYRGFSVGRLYPHVHVDPRAFGDVFVDWPCYPKCTPRCLHSRVPSWALAMNFCLCKYTKARKILDKGSVWYLAPRGFAAQTTT